MSRLTHLMSWLVPLRVLCGLALALIALQRAEAGDILRPNPGSSQSSGNSSSHSSATPAPVNSNASDLLRRATAALQAVQNMQAAARAAAASTSASLGINPNSPTTPLADVPDASTTVITPASPGSTGPGLQVAVNSQGQPVLWQGASLPIQASNNPNQVTITQSQQQAYLQWQTFDIGKNTSLIFDQSEGLSSVSNWIAFNYVRDPSGRPSQILGSISTTGPVDANGNPTLGGQVYVLNANGIIFGGTSQVNAYALVASSLPINSNLIQRGLLNNPDDQFLFSAIALPAGTNGPTPGFDPTVAATGVAPIQTPFLPDGSGVAGTTYGDILVEPGATLTAPSSAGNVGGRVALIGSNVTNAGTIQTPDGQTILAAGLQVGWVAHKTSDPTLRGLDVYVGSIGDTNSSVPASAGVVNNADTGTGLSTGEASSAAGLIEADRGNVTLVGSSVNQLGVIESSTSVAYNGRVDLLASYDSVSSGGNSPSTAPFFPQKSGIVTLGSDSLTEILPELASSDTIAATSLSSSSTVNIQGSSVNFEGNSGSAPNSGAILLAPSGNVSVDAGSWYFTEGGVLPSGTVEASSAATFIFDKGQITMADGSAIDVSGSENVSASVQEDIVSVQLLGPQLADSPVQRNGPLRGQTIQVDILDKGVYNGAPWVGTPLADTSGYIGLIPHTVGELTANGGTVTLNAGASVVLGQGSTIDLAGGWINYQGGMVETTKLLYGNQVIDISQATPSLTYEGIYTGVSSATDSKWGVTSTSANAIPLETYQAGYVQGGNGGTLAITAAAITPEGVLFGQTYGGSNQREPFVSYTNAPLLALLNPANIDPRVWELESTPQLSTLNLTFEEQYEVAPAVYSWYSPSPPNVYLLPAGGVAPTDPNGLFLSTSLTDPQATTYGGFGNLSIDNSADNYQVNLAGNLITPTDPTTMTAMSKFGSITVAANGADPQNISLQTAPGGAITLSAANIAVEGGVVTPGGNLSFTANDFWGKSPYLGSGIANFGVPAYNPARGNLVVAADATLSAEGLVIDDRSATGLQTPLITSGGTVSLLASNITVDPGAILSVSGGATIGATGKVTYGNGGSIVVKAGEDPASALASYAILGGTLNIDTVGQLDMSPDLVPLQGYSGGKGGSLTLEAPLVQVGESPGLTPTAGTLLLESSSTADGIFQSFFNSGGFSSFALNGIGLAETDANGNIVKDSAGNTLFYPAVTIAPGTQTDPTLVHPRVEQMQITVDPVGYQSTILSPLDYQNTPVSLAFNALGAVNESQGRGGYGALVSRGDLVLQPGAVIETDPETNGGSVSFSGDTVAILGTVDTPGGNIVIKGGADSIALFAHGAAGMPTVDLGPESELSAAGTTVLTADEFGRILGQQGYLNTGTVLAGGTVTLSGNIVTETGATINVSGWSDVSDTWGLLELEPMFSGSSTSVASPVLPTYVPTVVASNGGTITFNASQALFPDGTLMGAAGGPTAVGGTLSVNGATATNAIPFLPALLVTASGPTIPGPFYPIGQDAIGHEVVGVTGQPLTGTSLSNFAASSFLEGGFDSLLLHGSVAFQGNVTIAARGDLTVGDSGIVSASGTVNLSGSEVTIGQAYVPPQLPGDVQPPFVATVGSSELYPYPASYGTGQIFVSAGSASNPGLINLGNLSLQQIGRASFVSVGGDVQGYGTVDIAGQFTICGGPRLSADRRDADNKRLQL